jgi:hypothetical protein
VNKFSPSKKLPRGIILWKGSSLFNGEPIIVIATGFRGVENLKTGNMIQTWIIRQEGNTLGNYISGKDVCICGDCKHRAVASGGWGTCYVNVYQGPYQVSLAYQRGSYQELNAFNVHFLKGKKLRLGAYGDPGSVPLEVWENICGLASSWTGYTHAWKKDWVKPYSKFLMASCDNVEETIEARKLGWRTFRIKTQEESLLKKEFICPASEEAGKKRSCENCLACKGGIFNKGMKGQFTAGKGTVAITIHGRPYKVRRFTNFRKLVKAKKSYRHLLPKH